MNDGRVARSVAWALLDGGDYATARSVIEDMRVAAPSQFAILWSELLWRQSRYDELEQFSSSLRDDHDPGAQALKLLNDVRIKMHDGQYDVILRTAPAFLSSVDSRRVDALLCAALHGYVGQAWFYARDLEKSLESLRLATAAYETCGEDGRLASCLGLMGRCEIGLGRWASGIALLQRGLSVVNGIVDPVRTNFLLQALGSVLLFRGWFEAAGPVLERALRLSEEIGCDRDVGLSHTALGLLRTRQGQTQDASRHLLVALRLSRTQESKRTHALASEYLGELALVRRKPQDAWRWLRRSIAVASSVGQRVIESEAKARGSEALLALGKIDEAEGLLDEALSEFTSAKEPYEVAVCRRIRAQICTARNDWVRASEEIDHSLAFLEANEERFESRRLTRLREAVKQRVVVPSIRDWESVGGESQRLLRRSVVRAAAVLPRLPGSYFPDSACHHPDFPEFLGTSKALLSVLEQAKKIATLDVPVLIEGETGTGKELLARALHRLSARSDKRFVPFNSGTSSSDLFDAELFGYVKGAFTGAAAGREGLCRRADGGTLFMDEIAELAPASQPRLLRLLDSGEVRPVGSDDVLSVDVRFVAATHSEVLRLVESDRFRKDLYFRLASTRLQLPNLRDRLEDLGALVHSFVQLAQSSGRTGFQGVTERVLEQFAQYDWPGNIRELRNEVMSLAAHTEHGYAQDWVAPGDRVGREVVPGYGPITRELLKAELWEARGNVTVVSERLRINRTTLYRYFQEFGIRPQGFRT